MLEANEAVLEANEPKESKVKKKKVKEERIYKEKISIEEWVKYTDESLAILLADRKWITQMEIDYPTVNIQRTTEKSFESYFSTQKCCSSRNGKLNCNWKAAMNFQLGPKGGCRVFKKKVSDQIDSDMPDYSKLI